MPTHAAQSLLRPDDIIKGNVKAVAAALAVLLLRRPQLPGRVPEAMVMDFFGAARWTSTSNRTLGRGARRRRRRAHREVADELPPRRDSAGGPGARAGDAGEGPGGPSRRGQDLRPLLVPGEAPGDLAALTADELLLRWLNLKLRGQTPSSQGRQGNPLQVSSASELNGRVFLDLLGSIAPDILGSTLGMRMLELQRLGDLAEDGDEPMPEDERISQVVVECSLRCFPFQVLAKEDIDEGHADAMMALLAALFLSRPSLPVSAGSELHGHAQHLLQLGGQNGMMPTSYKDGGID
ncbi:unnamed protein product [Prorocentrum cordatum]|uniref:Calponin-homology (CH) domain-containing protein n=1 Tax=Prorocentrum cordatum TaxID=2364126 RepID=A0ABN9UEN5_9DINO|nr:unnamed protein product [Polarella glacialis]